MKPARTAKSIGVIFCVAILCIVVAMFVMDSVTSSRKTRRFAPEEIALTPSTTDMATPWIAPGVIPQLREADQASISDDEPLIGVVIRDEPRAYLLSAMSGMSVHVVNDIVSDTCLSVTYCDRTDRARVFTDPSTDERMGLQQGGWSGDTMLLRLNSKFYEQHSADIPLEDVPFERTTWKDWKAKHSSTKVYDGRSS